MEGTGSPVIFLDFDGVICDSIKECFVSSWIAYKSENKSSSVPIRHYELFRSYRPFIRRGGDYVLLQRCIELNIRLASQNDFDVQAALVGDAEMDRYHEDFYSAREELLRTDRSFWLGLNSIYPAIHNSLKKATGTAWILTTKKVDFALEIAVTHGLNWDRTRIICSGKERKLDIIAGIISQGPRPAVFVDDQIDHFEGAEDPRVACYLASWGYVIPEWLERDVNVIDEGEFNGLIETWLAV